MISNYFIYKNEKTDGFLFESIPNRIISLVPSQTELLYDLGLEDSLVGITKFCVHPNHLRNSKIIVGGTKSIKLNKIKELKPNIIICNQEENTLEMVLELSQFCPVLVTQITTIDDNLKMIEEFGRLFNRNSIAQKWIVDIQLAYKDFQNFISNKPYRKVAYFIWANPYMIAGKNTFINEMLVINRFINCSQRQESRYPEITTNEMKKLELDMVLLSSEPFPFNEKHIIEFEKYFNKAKIIFVDGEMFSWYGSRLLQSFEYFKTIQKELR